jgi:hypothetical protein
MSEMKIPSFLGVGVVTKNTIDACIDVANTLRHPIMLIASRRQIEDARLGGGYVEGWDQMELSDYVRARDANGYIMLCRDHGGPWQHPRERAQKLSETDAMASCLESFKSDILAGFSLLHIDTCLDADELAARNTAITRLIDLYTECHVFAQKNDRNVLFEIGFEDQGIDTNDPRVFLDEIRAILRLLSKEGLPPPTFIVAQTGMKVIETVNTGAITLAPSAVGFAIYSIACACDSLGLALKAHNADYLSLHELTKLRACGVAAINVAPEFGTTETRALLALLDTLGLRVQRERFLTLAYESRKWEKWLAPNTLLSDYDRAVIAGHYVFGNQRYKEIESSVTEACERKGMDLNTVLQNAIGARIQAYANVFSTAPPVFDGSFDSDLLKVKIA